MPNTDSLADDLGALLPAVCALAAQAGARILEVYDTDFAVRHKDDSTPLTAADMAAHKTICAGLMRLTPDVPILSEESVDVDYSERCRWSRHWLVDPLDGTREFVKRNGEFTVNIALIEDHRPVLGVVYVPVTGVCYFAGRGGGAFRQAAGEAAIRIYARKTDINRIAVAGSRSHGGSQLREFVARLPHAELIAIGSSLKSCLIAEGCADIYPRFGPTSEWDTAAAQCIVEEAGGIVTDLALRPLRYNTRAELVNPSFLAIADPAFDWRPFLPAGTQ